MKILINQEENMCIMHLYKIQQNFFLKQVFAALVLFTMLSLYGGDMIKTIERLDGRPYVRNNTWNGCCVFDTVGNTSFQVEDFSKEECVFAACLAIHHVRYGRNVRIPLDYYEKPIELDECERASNVVRKVEINFEQFGPPIGAHVNINGIALDEMKIRVLPFKVSNTNSKSDLRCMLVAFFHEEAFCLAVYVNMNNGKVALDFHEVAMDGYMLIAHESRYPYLTPGECDIQAKVYIKYFRQREGNAAPLARQGFIPDVSTNDLEVSVGL